MLVWLLDRGAALAAYATLWLAVLAGIGYNAKRLGALHRASRLLHVPASVLASVTVLLHVAVGTLDSGLVLAGAAPHPAYTDAYFLVGLGVGLVALVILVTATLAFLDPKQFERPWDPRFVHLFAYAGFAFATLHAIGVGSDVVGVVVPALVAATLLLLVALGARFVGDRGPGPRGS